MQLFGSLLPGSPAARSSGIQCAVELAQVPAQAMRLVRPRQGYTDSARFRLSNKCLGRDIQPAQQEQRVLATQVTAFAQLSEGCRADRVIVASLIQHARLVPNRCGQDWPSQMLLTSSRIYGREEARSHDSYPTTPNVRPLAYDETRMARFYP